ncbi:MAG: hypothetical protein JWR09_831 [Mucilaginibacter sp.]|nr:hypothetical protein [Mucilaginibacter sp.]
MKKHLFLSVVIGILICRANSAISKNFINYTVSSITVIQARNQDTIKYLQDNIISHKEKFQHKELNVMLKELHLDVKSYLAIRGSKPGGPSKGIILFFEDSKVKSKKLHNLIPVPSLNIYFENEIPWDEAWKFRFKSKRTWLEGEKEFYGKMLVKDITE